MDARPITMQQSLREEAHNMLQIHSSLQSKSWKQDWKKVEDKIYRNAA